MQAKRTFTLFKVRKYINALNALFPKNLRANQLWLRQLLIYLKMLKVNIPCSLKFLRRHFSDIVSVAYFYNMLPDNQY